MIEKTFLIIIQAVFLVILAPLISGIIHKLKNNLRMRKGASVFQPYYNFVKLIAKDEVISRNTSWIFRATPVIVLGSVFCVCFLLPVLHKSFFLGPLGDMLAVIFVFSLGRFFLALAALDAAGSFGGMGSSREVFIASFAEPATLVSIFVLGLNCGSLSPSAVASLEGWRFSSLLCGSALGMVALAETARIPVDNQETHLELTMVHEAMVLEYSGRSLALLELAAHIKQIIFFTILSWVFFPCPVNAVWGWAWFIIKLCIISVFVAVTEISLAKMRLFRVLDYLGFAFLIAILSAVFALIGM
ncbi:MAG: NADH-quinone oxidoreductase subunit H [Candidatus Omnitrophota bacterium]|nr:NADH-quinone oxidoreductase subunit H [Candidatus Omnitrophota bacterium]